MNNLAKRLNDKIQNGTLHTANSQSEAIELGTYELRQFYGDFEMEVTLTFLPHIVKIYPADTNKFNHTVWTY